MTTLMPMRWHHGRTDHGGNDPRHTGELPVAYQTSSVLLVRSRLVFGAPITTIGYAAAFAPRVEMYTQLACRVHRSESFPDSLFGQPLVPHVPEVSTNPSYTLFIPNASYEDPETRKECTKDPVVQAAVAKLSASMSQVVYYVVCILISYQ